MHRYSCTKTVTIFGNPFRKLTVFMNRLTNYILPVFNVSEIRKSIIRTITINMINFILWPFASNIKPSNPMSKKILIVYRQFYIPDIVFAPSKRTNFNWSFAFSVIFPSEQTSFWFISKKEFQSA